MKLNRFKIIIAIIIVVLVIILIPIVKNRIMFYQVKNKLLANLYEIQRNGNFHISYISTTKYNGEIFKDYNEEYGKDGIGFSKRKMDNDDNSFIIYTGLNEIANISEQNDCIYGGIVPSSVFETGIYFPVANIANYVLYDEYKFQKVEKGTYKGKNCYIVEIAFVADSLEDTHEEKAKLYIDPEKYLPYGSIYKINEETTEIEYETIEIGTVEEIPFSYDIEKIKEKSVSQISGKMN